MAGLEFLFDELIDEIRAVSNMARAYIDASSAMVLPRLSGLLETIREKAGDQKPVPWGIPKDMPLRTQVSRGEYEPDSKGGLSVYAEITSIWEILPLGPAGSKHSRHRKLMLSGNASTVIRLHSIVDQQSREIAVWRMEIGDDRSPGCHFHIHALHNKLPVPRFAAYFATPAVALEFVLGELFQDRWREEVARRTDDLGQWRQIQGERLRRFLGWQIERLNNTTGSPWMALKTSKPDPQLFLQTKR